MLNSDVRETMKPTIAVDFDGVIHQYDGWKDGTIYGTVMPGCVETLQRLKDAGWNIIVHSSRACDKVVDNVLCRGQLQEMYEWLNKHKVPYQSIWANTGKPLADLYLDDRGVRFCGWLGEDAFALNCHIKIIQRRLQNSTQTPQNIQV